MQLLAVFFFAFAPLQRQGMFIPIVKKFPPLFIITFQPHLPLSHLPRFESLFYFLFVAQKVTQTSFDIALCCITFVSIFEAQAEVEATIL